MSAEAQRFLELVRGSRELLLTGPEGPDGDSIGACLALRRVLATAAPDTRVDVAGAPGHRYAFLPDVALMRPDVGARRYDGVVVLDGDRRRVSPDVGRAFDQARWTGIIDHHRSTDTSVYGVVLFEPEAESTCGMVYRLAQEWGAPLDRELATLLYAGVIFDTGAFRYSNTRASTHRFAAALLEEGIDHSDIALRILMQRRPAALRLLGRLIGDVRFEASGRLAAAVCTRGLLHELGAVEADLEGVVDQLLNTEGVELAVLVVERGPEKIRLSLRSAGRVDVSALAHGLHANGGGHAKAAGVVLHEPLERVEARLCSDFVRAIESALSG